MEFIPDRKIKYMLRVLIKIIFLTIGTLITFILVLEVAYRYQWFDFYKAELQNLNLELNRETDNKKVLICGDSFTADPISYVTLLRDSMNNFDIINAAVPGSCILQHAIYMPDRIKKYKPEIFIYQFYAGNDLFDIRHPYHSNEISMIRKVYWFLSDRLLCLSYLNFRLAGVRYRYYDDAGGNYAPKAIDTFSINSYSKREKFNYKAEPDLLENTLHLKNGRDLDWVRFKSKFRGMIGSLDDSVSKYFLFMPHEAMMTQSLRNKHKSLGAWFTLPASKDYPLIKEIQALCKEVNMHLVDYSHPAIDSVSLENLFYANDPHLNSFGQQILGNQIRTEIKTNEFQN